MNAGQFRWLKQPPPSPEAESEAISSEISGGPKDILNKDICYITRGQISPYTPVSDACQGKSEDTHDPSVIDLSMFTPGHAFTRIKFMAFNPGSHKQCIDRLWEFGWSPTSKTRGHLDAERDRDTGALNSRFLKYGWKIDDENLATVPLGGAREPAQLLTRWLLLRSRLAALVTWRGSVRASRGYPRVHGRFNHIGAWTQRMSHAEPNMANIPSNIGRDGLVAEYGREFRSLWTAPPDGLLIGTDADSIQLRVLAHYMSDQRFINALVAGRKEDGTDAHSLNKEALGPVCRARDVAKTFVYAWLLGAGRGKVSRILGCSSQESEQAVRSFVNSYPGLLRLKEEIIPLDARRGYFVGFDGRKTLCSSEHHMLAGYLQCGEAVVMKRAAVLWNERLMDEQVPYLWVNFVHDEFVTEVSKIMLDNQPKQEYGDLYKLGEYIGQVQAWSIEETGKRLGLNCPMKGNFKLGKTWYDIH